MTALPNTAAAWAYMTDGRAVGFGEDVAVVAAPVGDRALFELVLAVAAQFGDSAGAGSIVRVA